MTGSITLTNILNILFNLDLFEIQSNGIQRGDVTSNHGELLGSVTSTKDGRWFGVTHEFEVVRDLTGAVMFLGTPQEAAKAVANANVVGV